MISISLNDICIPNQLLQGWRRIKKNRGRKGMNNLSNPWTIHQKLNELSRSLCHGDYRPSPLAYYPANVNDKMRTLLLPTLEDRIIQSAISLKLTELFDPLFEDCSFAYRPVRSIQMAQQAVLQWIQNGYQFIIRTDILNCFDTIPFLVIQETLLYYLSDPRLINLIMQFITAPILKDNQIYQRSCGIPQGAPLSPLLCNIVLDIYDKSMIQVDLKHIRYADDLVLMGKSKDHTRQALHTTVNILYELGLQINWEKTYETDGLQGFRFLGDQIQVGGTMPWQTIHPSY